VSYRGSSVNNGAPNVNLISDHSRLFGFNRTRVFIAVSLVAIIVAISSIGAALAYQAAVQNTDNSTTATYSLLSFQDSSGNDVSASQLTSGLSEYSSTGLTANHEYKISAEGLRLRYLDTTDTSSQGEEEVKDLAYLLITQLSGTNLGNLENATVMLRVGGSIATSYVSVIDETATCQLVGNTFVATHIGDDPSFNCEYIGQISLIIIPYTDVSAADTAALVGNIIPTLTAYHSKVIIPSDGQSSTGRLTVGSMTHTGSSGDYETNAATISYSTQLSTGSLLGLLKVSGTLPAAWEEDYVTAEVYDSVLGTYSSVTGQISSGDVLEIYVPLVLTNGGFSGTVALTFAGGPSDEYPSGTQITFEMIETTEQDVVV